MLRKLYLSPLGYIISFILNAMAFIHKPFMVYGFYNRVQKRFYKNTRISSSAKLIDKQNIDIKDNAWIGHYCLLDGIGGIVIGEGVNIASHTCIYTHSSQNSIRLLGKKFIEIEAKDRIGYIIEKVEIGEYVFIGTSCVILPGTKIGKGAIVGAGSVVKGEFPDFAVIVGNPAKVVGDSRKADEVYFDNQLVKEHYFDKNVIKND
ncbi:MAG: acyltransferase [Bacteroidetes bacterium]|nr:acyltransferase [Bacteroidota bacterium]